MAKAKKKAGAGVDRVAEAVGHTLGTIAGTIDSLHAQHPHPVEEAREALTAGQERLATVTSRAGARATAIVKKAKAVARKTKKLAPGASVTRTAQKAVTRAKKASSRSGRARDEARRA